MKSAALWLSLLVCVAFVGSLLLAEDAPKSDEGKVLKEGQKPKAELQRALDKGAKLGDIATKMDKVVGGFSSDQKDRIVVLNKTREEALKKLNDQFQADVTALMTIEQKEKWEQALKEGGLKDGGVKKDGAPKEGKVAAKGDNPEAKKQGKIKGDEGTIKGDGEGDAAK